MDITELYEQIDAAGVQRLVDEKREEDLFLDFKTITRSDLSSKEDRKNFAKALSGFANSSGGIILWGVDARKQQQDGPDCACAVRQIDSVSTFVSRLNEFTGMFVRPVVDGVRHRTICTRDDRGYAITLVPESDAGPHMALAGEQRYYKRSGSSFYPLEHFDIEDMFGRRRKPRFCVTYKIKPSMRGGNPMRYEGQIAIGLENQGRGSATNLFVALRVPAPYGIRFSGIDGMGEGLPRLAPGSPNEQKYGGNPGLVLHPGMSHDIAAIRVEIYENQDTLSDCSIEADVAADGVPLHRLTTVIPGADIIPVVLEKGP